VLDLTITPYHNNSWRGDVRNKIRWFDDIIDHWKAVGIIPVLSIGNSGPECGTANYPGNSENVIGVGSTDINDSVDYFSSRGPSKDSGAIKPDISAPGVYVLSASNSGPEAYEVTSGTSMAAPQVAGAIALMLEANSSLQFEDILWSLRESADSGNVLSSVDLKCEQPGRTQIYPNNYYGYGRLNVRKVRG